MALVNDRGEGADSLVDVQENKSPEKEADELTITATNTRGTRLREEDEFLATNPEQRRVRLLDYFRRERLSDGSGLEIMPEIISALPELFKTLNSEGKPYVDFSSQSFSEQKSKKELAELFKEIEDEVVETDKTYRKALEKLGFKAQLNDGIFIDAKRFNFIREKLASISPDRLAKVQGGGTMEDKILKLKNGIKLKLIKSGLFSEGSEEIEAALENFAKDQSVLNVDIGDSQKDSPIKKFIYDFISNPQNKKGNYIPSEHGFAKISTMSDYEGEVLHFDDIELGDYRRNSVKVLKRGDKVTGIEEGGTIIDGNFGYKSTGELDEVEGVKIIDHHDGLETQYAGKRYDTATVMVTRILSERFGNVKDKAGFKDKINKYIKEEGKKVGETGEGKEIRKINIFINHLDSDSVLSTWAYRNPRLGLKHKEIINAISTCGDFLLSGKVLEYGATARDYEYIIRTYLEKCQEIVKNKRVLPRQQELGKVQEKITLEASNFSTKSGVEISKDFTVLEQSLKDAYGKKLAEKMPDIEAMQARVKDPTVDKKMKGELSQQIKKLKEEAGKDQELVIFAQLIGKIGELIKQKQTLEKDITSLAKKPLTPEENSLILNHIFAKGVVQDVIENPFKYQEFLNEAREKERRTIEVVEEAYKKGEMEIRPDIKDGQILLIEPAGGKTSLPDYESIDGLYFFLRRRVDLNLPVVASHEGTFVSFAINTQNAKDLSTYDFNELVKRIKEREGDEIGNKIKEAEKSVDKKAQKKIAELNEDLENNKQGKLWRNRTQMVFCMKTHIPFDEIMNMVRNWKKDMEVSNDEKKIKKIK